jgi:hypothetical protein
VLIDNSTTALPKGSVTLFGQPPSSALLFIHPATVHFDFGKGTVDLTNIPEGQLEIDSSQVFVRVIDGCVCQKFAR